MSGGATRAGIAAAALLAAIATVAVLTRHGPRPGASDPAAAASGAHGAAGADGAGPARERGPMESHESGPATVEVPLAPTLAAAIAEGALGHLAGQREVADAIAEARAGRLEPVAFGLRLAEAVRAQPGAARPVLDALLEERSPELGLQLARALALGLDDPGLRRDTVEGLRAAPPAARATGLLALLGRPEKDVLDLSVAAFLDDATDARAAAGFVLGQRPGGVPEPEGERVRGAARAALGSRDAPPRLREASLGLLGRPGASETDLGLLETASLDGRDPAVRSQALAALVATDAPASRLGPTLERVAADAAAPEALRKVARAYLATR